MNEENKGEVNEENKGKNRERGAKPNLTCVQIQFLAEICEKHYDVMSKAFGGIMYVASFFEAFLFLYAH